MSIQETVFDAVAALTTDVSGAFVAAAPFILLTGGGFVAWRYVKRFLGKL